MSNVKRAAAVALSAALSVPFALTTASPAAAADPFDTASASLFAAAYKTQRVAQAGFHVVNRSSQPDAPGFGSRLDAWTNRYGEAAVRLVYNRAVVSSVVVHQGSYLSGSENGPRLQAWTLLNPGYTTKLDQQILKRVPNSADARFSVGAAPSSAESSANQYGFTADQVSHSFDRLGYMPWNAADIIEVCGYSDGDYSVTCTGEQTVDDTGKVWTFDVVSRATYAGEEFITNIKMLVKANSDGIITSARYDSEQGTSRLVQTSKAEYAERIIVPVPNLKKSGTVKSRDLTKSAARVSADVMAKDYTRSVDKYLKSRGLPLTPNTAKKAGAKLMPDALTWPDTQWVNSTGYSKQDGVYAFEAFGTDGITWAARTATPYVVDGKWVIEKSVIPPFPGGAMTRSASAGSGAEVERPLSPPMWEHANK